MFVRFFAIALLAFSLTACSTMGKHDGADDVLVGEREDLSANDALNGTEVYEGAGYEDVQGDSLTEFGRTQQDLAANVGDRVFFGYDRYDLSPEARITLDGQGKWLAHNSDLNVIIEGHADERGTREYNLALGERRAESVRNYLIAVGVDPRRISIISYGKERPAVLGSNEAAWAQNRRCVTKIQ